MVVAEKQLSVHETMRSWAVIPVEEASACSVSVDDVSNGVLELSHHFSDFMKETEWSKKAETAHVMEILDEFIQKNDMIADVIFTYIDVKRKPGSKQQQILCSLFLTVAGLIVIA